MNFTESEIIIAVVAALLIFSLLISAAYQCGKNKAELFWQVSALCFPTPRRHDNGKLYLVSEVGELKVYREDDDEVIDGLAALPEYDFDWRELK
jgi:hypothetical protein